jgi:hypothetical protein
MAILERSSKLIQTPPERGWADNLSQEDSTSPPANQSGPSPPQWAEGIFDNETYATLFGIPNAEKDKVKGRGKGWQRTARIRTPKAYKEVREALLGVEADLLPERRTNWEEWDGVTFQVFPSTGTQRRDAFTTVITLFTAMIGMKANTDL